ncbi:hydrolase [Sulfolobales archaeon HS-7]|nr:hydrolase [Sulfolobales archaeon HS-7]
MVVIDNEIVIDPHDGVSIGYERPEIEKVNLVLITHDHYDHNAYERLSYDKLFQSFVGLTECNGWKILGVQAFHDKVRGKKRGKTSMYVLEKKGIKYTHLGDLGHPLDSSAFEYIKNTKVMFIPSGGVTTISWDEAINIIRRVKPDIVVPIHYWSPGCLLPLDPLPSNLHVEGYEINKLNTFIDESEKVKKIVII